jgi:hypothetical protein
VLQRGVESVALMRASTAGRACSKWLDPRPRARYQ